ncbi:hypothetical protein AL535_005975 [Vibrio cholerae]|nr:hypothetical protein AL535_005975 [Vibrio cholerae]
MIKIISVLGLAIVAFNVNADVQCSGKVNTILQYANGSVNIHTTYRNEYTYICNTETRWNNISPEACRAMLSIVLSAQASDKNIQIYYSGNQFTCQSIPHYANSPAPVYVGIEK